MLHLEPLRRLSARIGHDLNLVQAGGGNTSIKDGDTLWVKASGKWLVHAAEEDMFLPAPLGEILRGVAEDRDYNGEHKIPSGESLRPSVETTMHAVLPHRVVIHVHSVNAIAWAVRPDGAEALRTPLDGLRWEWIPYIHPGLPLARRIQKMLGSKPDVLILGNHGLVVGGEDCESAEILLQEVERRLARESRRASAADVDALARLAGDAGWRAAPDAEVHTLATDDFARATAAGGTMYPDHCVYLGPAAATLEDGETITDAVARYEARYESEPVVILAAGKGVLVPPTFTRAARELLICLARVTARIDDRAPVQYLEDRQVAKLRNWDAEKYRIALARQQER
jgi:rhamnose utilization protein RhaD (predicted bifunctional aldolase and dehydrogenase)